MHASLDFLTKLKKFTSVAYSWSTSEEYKILGPVVPNKSLAANANIGSSQIAEFQKIQVWLWFYIVWAQQLSSIFTIYSR